MSTFTAQNDRTSGEQLLRATLSNGLTVLLIPRPGLRKKTAVFATRYGAIDQAWTTPDGRDESIPPGVAHFLEHQLFKKEDGDILAEFGKFGAQGNAWTDTDATAYYFHANDGFYPSLDLLLRLVLHPTFNPEWVDAEKPIIEQELRMYDDNPDFKVYHQWVQTVYTVHPVRHDVGGTVESIQPIDAPMLESVYRAFYSPSNLVLSISGDLDPDELLAFIQERVDPSPSAARPTTHVGDEPWTVDQHEVTRNMLVSRPKVLAGWKIPRTRAVGDELMKDDAITTLMLSLLFSKSAPTFSRLYSSGQIDDTFSFSFQSEPTYAYVTLSADTDDPAAWFSAMHRAITDPDRFKTRDLQRIKRRSLGAYVGAWERPETMAFMALTSEFHEKDIFRAMATLRSVTLNEVNDRVREIFHPDRLVQSVILPTEGD
jgi:predicted Zn-dependent peptidase